MGKTKGRVKDIRCHQATECECANVQGTVRGVQKNGSTDFAARLWNASHATFNNDCNWEVKLEDKHMKKSFLECDEPDETENVDKKTKG